MLLRRDAWARNMSDTPPPAAPAPPKVIRLVPKGAPADIPATTPVVDFLRALIAAVEAGELQPQAVVIHLMTGPSREHPTHVHWRWNMSQLEHLGLLSWAATDVRLEEL